MNNAVAMPDTADRIELINGVFEETALVVGGLVAMHHVNDDFVWRLIKGLDVIRCNALKRIDVQMNNSACAAPSPTRRHPAIEDFLRKLQRS